MKWLNPRYGHAGYSCFLGCDCDYHVIKSNHDYVTNAVKTTSTNLSYKHESNEVRNGSSEMNEVRCGNKYS